MRRLLFFLGYPDYPDNPESPDYPELISQESLPMPS